VTAAALTTATLEALAAALDRGAMIPPFSTMQLSRFVPQAEQQDALGFLRCLEQAGIRSRQAALVTRLMAAARRDVESKPRPQLVWSDLDLRGSRDTSIVLSELFREAEHSVLLSTYNLGHKARDGESPGNPVLRPLARRMAERPRLTVRLFVNLRRIESLQAADEKDVVNAFAGWFQKSIWPGGRLPEVYYDPRSLSATSPESACLHAKCVVVDDRRAFVTSANLTEAAQERNIEAGVLLEEPVFARGLRRQFESLIERRLVRRVPGLG
jgi:hypothetical protein